MLSKGVHAEQLFLVGDHRDDGSPKRVEVLFIQPSLEGHPGVQFDTREGDRVEIAIATEPQRNSESRGVSGQEALGDVEVLVIWVITDLNGNSGALQEVSGDLLEMSTA